MYIYIPYIYIRALNVQIDLCLEFSLRFHLVLVKTLSSLFPTTKVLSLDCQFDFKFPIFHGRKVSSILL